MKTGYDFQCKITWTEIITWYFPSNWTSLRCRAWIQEHTDEPFIRDEEALDIYRGDNGTQFWFTHQWEESLA